MLFGSIFARPAMHKSLSIYLDLMRFMAALLVFFYHAKYSRFQGEWLNSVGAYGHDAVIVFFVLSGFVIAYVANNKEKDIGEYTKSRLARLYSVAIPALLLTVVADFIGQKIDPYMYLGDQYQGSEPVLRIFLNALFVNELWFSSWRAFSNGPFWSLSYEFWYYLIFSGYFYFSGWKKYFFTAAAALVAGPKILLLLPVWLMGVGLYYTISKIRLSNVAALMLAIVPVVLYCMYRDLGISKYLLSETLEYLGRDFVYDDLKFSRRFVNDYLVGVMFSLHLIGMSCIVSRMTFLDFLEKPIRYFAGMTFSLYLFHYPLLQLFGTLAWNGYTTVVLTFMSVMLLAPYTEGKKREWRNAIEAVLGFVARRTRPMPATG